MSSKKEKAQESNTAKEKEQAAAVAAQKEAAAVEQEGEVPEKEVRVPRYDKTWHDIHVHPSLGVFS